MSKLSVKANDDFDIIKKPRTNFTNNVLRRAIPNINIQDKIGSISMNKLNVLSAMRLGPTGGSQVSLNDSKKVKTVSNLPKVQSLDSRMMNDILPRKNKRASNTGISDNNSANSKPFIPPTNGLDGIVEGKDGEEDLDDEDSEDSVFNKDDAGSDSDEDSGESSIDMDGEEDEEKLYAKIISEQDKAANLKESKKKGEHLNDLVD